MEMGNIITREKIFRLSLFTFVLISYVFLIFNSMVLFYYLFIFVFNPASRELFLINTSISILYFLGAFIVLQCSKKIRKEYINSNMFNGYIVSLALSIFIIMYIHKLFVFEFEWLGFYELFLLVPIIFLMILLVCRGFK